MPIFTMDNHTNQGEADTRLEQLKELERYIKRVYKMSLKAK